MATHTAITDVSSSALRVLPGHESCIVYESWSVYKEGTPPPHQRVCSPSAVVSATPVEDAASPPVTEPLWVPGEPPATRPPSPVDANDDEPADKWTGYTDPHTELRYWLRASSGVFFYLQTGSRSSDARCTVEWECYESYSGARWWSHVSTGEFSGQTIKKCPVVFCS